LLAPSRGGGCDASTLSICNRRGCRLARIRRSITTLARDCFRWTWTAIPKLSAI
jgi:hypothetical protein